MSRKKGSTFGRVIRQRRRQLDMTQQQVARRIKTSTPYIGHLEAGKRHRSERVVSRLAEILRLGRRELFLLANAGTAELLAPQSSGRKSSAWEGFRRDERLGRLYHIADEAMDVLSRVALLGEIGSPRDFIYIRNTVRHALGR